MTHRLLCFGMPLKNVFCWPLISFVAVLFLWSPCSAHKVNVFAYVDGDNLVINGYFSGKVKAQGAAVEVYDSSGSRIQVGKTDSTGVFLLSLKSIPLGTGKVRVVVEAEMGHKGEYWVDLTQDTVSPGKPGPEAVIPKPETIKANPASGHEGSPDQKHLDDLAATLDGMLDRKLAPLMGMLARQERLLAERQMPTGPGFTEIIGGIGWIVGLAGLGAFCMASRRRS